MTLDERIARYLDKIPGAISGSDGHGQTFTVACALVNGFAIDADAALRHLKTYNAKCSPPWEERDLRHKVEDAEKKAHSRPRGHLLGTDDNRRPEAVHGGPKVVPVRLTPKKRQFRTGRTVLSNISTHTREKEDGSTHISVGDLGASEVSEADGWKGEVKLPTPGGSTVDWTTINAEHPPTADDEAWRAVEAAGFGDEPLIALAFALFGPGCQVVSAKGE